MSEIVVRDAGVDDARAILEVRCASWQTAYAHIFPTEALAAMTVDPWLQWWHDAIASPQPHMHTLVAERDGEVVGFAQLGATLEDAAADAGQLYAIYARPDAWGLGVGRALMAETLGRFSVEEFADAILWVLKDNARTRRFYELAGWQADGGVKDEEWLGTLVREVRYRIALDSAS